MTTTRIKTNNTIIALISIFLMQVLEWVPLSISQTGISTGTGTGLGGEEDTPHVWNRLHDRQESGPTGPKEIASLSIFKEKMNTTPGFKFEITYLSLKFLNITKLYLINLISTVHVVLLSMPQININHCKSSIFLCQFVTTNFGMNFKSYDPYFSANLVSCLNFNWVTTHFD